MAKFHAPSHLQQSVVKALRSVLVLHNVPISGTHNLMVLLSQYAFATRYSDDYVIVQAWSPSVDTPKAKTMGTPEEHLDPAKRCLQNVRICSKRRGTTGALVRIVGMHVSQR